VGSDSRFFANLRRGYPFPILVRIRADSSWCHTAGISSKDTRSNYAAILKNLNESRQGLCPIHLILTTSSSKSASAGRSKR
jgi:hypothetical protein